MKDEHTLTVGKAHGFLRGDLVNVSRKGGPDRIVLACDQTTITWAVYRWYHWPLRWWRRFWDWIS